MVMNVLTKKIIYYWSPFLTNIATSKAVINSAYSVKKFLKDYEPSIIDAAGEFESKKQEIKDKNISLIKSRSRPILNDIDVSVSNDKILFLLGKTDIVSIEKLV